MSKEAILSAASQKSENGNQLETSEEPDSASLHQSGSHSSDSKKRSSSRQVNGSQSESPEEDPSPVVVARQDAGALLVRDINAKIDELEKHISHLMTALSQSQGALQASLDELYSRSLSMAEDIEQAFSRLDQSSSDYKRQTAALDERLKTSTETIHSKLEAAGVQIGIHQDRIDEVSRHLNQSHQLLESKIRDLELSAWEKMGNLESDVYLKIENLDGKADILGDQLFEMDVSSNAFRRQTRIRFRTGAIIIAAVMIGLAGMAAYLAIRHTPENAGLQFQLADFKTEMDQNLSRALNKQSDALKQQYMAATNSLSNLDKEVAALTDTMQRNDADTGRVLEEVSGSLESIADRLAALELSVYGPKDVPAESVLEIQDQQWLSTRDAGHYSIQVVGVYRQAALIAYANRFSDSLTQYTLAYNVSTYRGRDWYNLFYGDFASYDEAQNILESLPGGIQNNQPWIRRMGSIQSSANSQ
ncbi:hypothetical protein BTA51_20465 [Hahella sp. CCB-MM4]|uniref:SPOR domain-containing protein n=1 Tax=Hahella sp. (strain CCB-MM4) TaxID=1926491 RepID=UPI000B9C6DE9|nr:SPOR domain-containing protein [Hahella sp. CCB-MM4]OZG71651.1 hypothetical protein BTA51_20465 [Hahella sp. CCB-MM4]